MTDNHSVAVRLETALTAVFGQCSYVEMLNGLRVSWDIRTDFETVDLQVSLDREEGLFLASAFEVIGKVLNDMTWSLNAHGAVDPGLTDEQAKTLEADLATALHEVLSRPEFGTQHSTLGSRWWQGRVHISHEPPPAPQSAPEPNPADMPPITNGGPGYEPQDGPTSSEPTAAAPTAGQQEAAN